MSDANHDNPCTIGAHTLRSLSPGLAHITVVGDVTGDDTERLLVQIRRLAEESGDFFLIADVARMGRVLPEAGHRAVQHPVLAAWRGTAFVGASFLQRSVVKFIYRGSRLIHGKEVSLVGFFATEAEARAWIDGQRQTAR